MLQLNGIAITQMRTLLTASCVKRLKMILHVPHHEQTIKIISR